MSWDDKRSKDYDGLHWVCDPRDQNGLIKVCQPRTSDVVLDVGTGTGVIAKAFLPYVKRVIGVDSSDAMLQVAKERRAAKGFELVCKPIEEYKFASLGVDIVIARMVLHHILDDMGAMRHIGTQLKSGARVAIEEGIPHPGCREWYMAMFARKEDRHVYSADILVDLLEEADCEPRSVDICYNGTMGLNNWLDRTCTPPDVKEEIWKMHVDAPDYVKAAYSMEIGGGDIYMTWRKAVVMGVKR